MDTHRLSDDPSADGSSHVHNRHPQSPSVSAPPALAPSTRILDWVMAAEQAEVDGRGGSYRNQRTSSTEKDPLPMDEYPPAPEGLATEENNRLDEDFTITEALDIIGIGPFHYRLLVVVGLISIAGGLGSTGFALFPPLARCHLNLSSVAEAILTSSGFLGAACGGVGMGYLATRFGRRTELLILIVWTSYFGFLSAVSPDYYWLLFMRFLVGFGHGGTGQRLSILFEYMPAQYRTLGAGVLTFCWNCGNFLEAVFIKVLIPTGSAWRYILVSDAAVFFICIFFQSWLPESPLFLFNIVGDRRKARQKLEYAAKLNGKTLPAGRLISAEERQEMIRGPPPYESDDSLSVEKPKTEEKVNEQTPLSPPSASARERGIMSLFRPAALFRTTILLAFAWLMLSIAVVGCAILTEEVLQERQSLKGKCTNHFSVYHKKSCEELSAKDYTPIMVIFASEFPALFVTYFSANILGRKVALALAFVLSGVFFALLLICPIAEAWTTFFLAGSRMMVTTCFSLMIIYTPEVYPTYARGMAVGLSRAVYRVGSAGVPFLSQVLLRESSYASKSVHAGACIITGFMLLLLPIETRNRDLDD
ncbi:synaptic vesicle 2-related protein-like [Sycon ciliatum]|uniref:synaptic vesicle 2-related protein-like n=1 Tax=Sycon ciliatum TaxID=27933 RepID=UPI0031F6C4F6